MKIKKVFFLIPILLFLVSCKNIPTVEFNSAKKTIIFEINHATDEVFADGKLAWKVWRIEAVTDEFLNEYDSHVEFIIDEVENKYVFLPSVTLRDFQLIEVEYRMTEGVTGFQFHQKSVLCSAGDLPPEVPFVVTTMNSDMPNRGISFLDENGERRYFVVGLETMSDEGFFVGAFIIIEIDN